MTQNPSITTLLAAILALPAVCGAQTINVDLNHGNPNHYTGPGIIPEDVGTVWNSLDVGASPVSVTIPSGGVVDSEGGALPGVSVAIASNDGTSGINRYSTENNSVPNPSALMRDYTFSGTYDVTLQGLDQGTYELWFFGHGDQNDQTGSVTVDAANGGGGGSTANSPLGRDLINGGEGVSFVRLGNLSVDASGTFGFRVDDFLNGFQLRRTSGEQPAGEQTPPIFVDCGGTSYTGTAVAQAPGTTWNIFPPSQATSMTVDDVFASDGSTLDGVGVTISTSGSELRAYANDTPGDPNPLNLMRDYYYGGNFTVEIGGLDPGAYVLHVFAHGDQANQNSTVTVAAANGGGSGTTDASSSDNRNLFAPGAEGRTFLSFPVAPDSGGNLSFTSTGYLTGFQLHAAPAVSFTTVPEGAVIADGQSHTLTALAESDEAVTYQWRRSTDGTNYSDVTGATAASLTLTASAATSGYYTVVASVPSGSIVSPAVYFGVGSSESYTVAPSDGAVGIAIDQPLRLRFPGRPRLGPTGELRIHDASNGAVVVRIDRSTFQTYSVDSITLENAATDVRQGSGYFHLPIAVYGNEVWVSPGTGQRLSYGRSYYVTMDAGLLYDSSNQPVSAITDPDFWSFSTRESRPGTPTAGGGPTKISVAMDGGGDFATLQGALDWIPANNTLPRTILVEPGTYHEAVHIGQNRRHVSIVGTGESREDVRFHHPSPATTDSRSAGVIRVTSDDVRLRNLTLDCGAYLAQPNPAGAGYPDLPIWPGRINVILTTADRLVCEDLLVMGSQDTVYANSGSCYFEDCEIWGSVDFIYGSALAVFDDCDIVQVRPSGGPIAAPSTDDSDEHGIVFIDSRFPRALVADGYPHDVAVGSTTFMRPWRKDGATEVINCVLDTHISTKAWGEWGGREATCRAREYGNTMAGGGAAPSPAERRAAGAFWVNTVDPDYNPASDDETDSDVAHPGGSGNRQEVTVDPADYSPSVIFGAWVPETAAVLFPDGYGSMATGGGDGAEVTVSTVSELVSFASSPQPYVISVSGTIDLTGESGSKVRVASGKTIRGADSSAAIIGALDLDGERNIIISGLTISNPNGDGISVRGASDVHISRCTFFDCADGACDITHGADYVTVSWCRFHYTPAQTEHKFAMILGNTTQSNYHVTLHHNWFAEGCNSRMPSGSYSRAHIYNNYFSSSGNFYCTNVRVNGEFLVENNRYEGVNHPCYKQDGGRMFLDGNEFEDCTGHPGGWDSSAGALTGNDQVFRPPYAYSPDPAGEVAALVSAGAGSGGTVDVEAEVGISGLLQIENGSPRPVEVSTVPAGLAVSVTYDGGSSVPSAPGTYAVEAVVTEPGYTGSVSGELVIAASNSWIAWVEEHFTPEEIEAGEADPEANPDDDFLPNLGEYSLGTDPGVFNRNLVPVLDATGVWIVFSRSADRPDVVMGAESSDDLVNWAPVPVEVLESGDPETVRVRDSLGDGDISRRFLRLEFLMP